MDTVWAGSNFTHSHFLFFLQSALEDDSENLSPSKVRQKLKEDPDMIDGLMYGYSTSKWVNYLKYGIAALAVGVTVAYNVAK